MDFEKGFANRSQLGKHARTYHPQLVDETILADTVKAVKKQRDSEGQPGASRAGDSHATRSPSSHPFRWQARNGKLDTAVNLTMIQSRAMARSQQQSVQNWQAGQNSQMTPQQMAMARQQQRQYLQKTATDQSVTYKYPPAPTENTSVTLQQSDPLKDHNVALDNVPVSFFASLTVFLVTQDSPTSGA